MANSRIDSNQIEDGGVCRDDLNVTGVLNGAPAALGLAVIRRAIQGTGISLSSNGYETGTGDVTINNTGVLSITGTANQVIASAAIGAVTLSLPQSIATTSNVDFGSINSSGQIRAKGWYSVGTGQAVEIGVSGGSSLIYSYDRTTAAFTSLGYNAQSHVFYTSGNTALTISSASNVNIVGTVTASNLSGTNTGDQTTVTGNSGSATLIAITDDTTTNATEYLTWVGVASGNQAQKVSSTKLTFNPSTGALTVNGVGSRFNAGVTYSAINTGFAASFGHSTGDYGVRMGTLGSGAIIQVAQGTTSYPLSLQPYGSNVIIGGTTDAGFKLDVVGTGRFSGLLDGTSTSGIVTSGGKGASLAYIGSGYSSVGFNDYGSTYLAGETGYGGLFQFDKTAGSLIYYTGTSVAAGAAHTHTSLFSIFQNGNVTINTTDAGYKLDVNGTVRGTTITASGLTSGRIPYVSTSGLITDTINLTWDNTQKVLNFGSAATSSWGSQLAVIEANGTNLFFGTGVDTAWNSNAYLSASSWIYKTTNPAVDLFLNAGNFQVRTAASGTAGTALTWNISMIMWNSGNLCIGNSTDSGYKLDVTGTTIVRGHLTFTGGLYTNSGSGTSGQILTSTGAGTSPTWNTITIPTQTDYIANQTSQQSSSNFNISGAGVIGTTLLIGNGATGKILGDVLVTAGSIFPNSNNAHNLGSTSFKWGSIFGVAGKFDGIAIGVATASGSAALDITSTTKGLLLPRMTKVQRDAITQVAGLVVFQTDNTPGLRVSNGTNWMRFTETVD